MRALENGLIANRRHASMLRHVGARVGILRYAAAYTCLHKHTDMHTTETVMHAHILKYADAHAYGLTSTSDTFQTRRNGIGFRSSS